jgi:hypothetical protein
MVSSSSVRNWAISSAIAGLLVGVGFSIPWFFASDASSVKITGSGWQGLANMIQTLLQGSASFLVVLLLALFLFLLLAALFFLTIGALGLMGRAARWMALTQIVAACVGVVALALGVGFIELIFYALANFDVPNPNAALIPGIGVLLMVAGLLTALVSGIRFLRSGRQRAGGAVPTS